MLGYSLTVDDALSLALIAILALPVFAAIICASVRGSRDARWVALISSVVCFLLTIPLLLNFQSIQGMSLGEINSIGFSFNIGVDSISVWLLALTTRRWRSGSRASILRRRASSSRR